MSLFCFVYRLPSELVFSLLLVGRELPFQHLHSNTPPPLRTAFPLCYALVCYPSRHWVVSELPSECCHQGRGVRIRGSYGRRPKALLLQQAGGVSKGSEARKGQKPINKPSRSQYIFQHNLKKEEWEVGAGESEEGQIRMSANVAYNEYPPCI